MGQALYRKYRSKTLAEMVGQEHVTDALGNSIKSGRISHAYLFTGPRGVGKTSAARILAHEINQLPYDESQHLDIIEIDAASNRRIDDIRDLRDKVHIAPTSSKFKVYIIDEVHMLTGESFNALLKTLEEPPEHVVFILATTEVHKLPATIVSRTQRFNFRLVEQAKVIGHLKSIAKTEKIDVDDEALALIAEHGEGSFRDSINLLDQLANVNGGKVDAASVERSLGLASKKAIGGLVDAILAKDFASTNKQLTALEEQGTNTASLIPQLTRYLQDLAPKHTELYLLMDELIEVPRSYNPKLKLRTLLTKFALPTAAAPVVAVGSSPASPAKETPRAAAKPTPVAVAKPILNVEKPQPAKPKARSPKEEPQHAQGEKITGLTAEQWSDILGKTREESVPLFGMLRHGQPEFDADKQTLTLKFRYGLHQKRIDDAKSKKILATIMMELLGGAPIIQTVLDTEATAPEIEIAPAAATPPPAPEPTPEQVKPVDTVAKSVMDMMGGGEVVNA
ncbi:MAG TPA: DNA polymerase III subunit gamma/tau [Candidatus Saccharimonadales bacterium]|nr:DNA polymerase III subunit gamma/tau [Candidatus Saccharimonadales bacterium]